jgi:hypothetical protein
MHDRRTGRPVFLRDWRQANGTDDTYSRLGLRWTAGAASARLSMVRFHVRGGL